MNKIFFYKLRRLMCSKFFLGMAAVTIWYGLEILNTVTILGVAHTAPFSPWSFGGYLAQILPLLCVTLLFLIWNQCNKTARRTELLTMAADHFSDIISYGLGDLSRQGRVIMESPCTTFSRRSR